MKKEEIRKILDNTKVYVNGKSKEIQKKLFSFGYKWGDNSIEIRYMNEPFLYIRSSLFYHGSDMIDFMDDENKEISADKILSLEITEPSYRPFKISEECLNEMSKHIPFGWLYDRYSGDFVNVSSIQYAAIELMPQVNEETIKNRILYNEAFKRFTFLDGSTFGIKQ